MNAEFTAFFDVAPEGGHLKVTCWRQAIESDNTTGVKLTRTAGH